MPLHLLYCASSPPSALHPTPLCHFCSLISFASAFSADFLWNPTANDGGLCRTTLLRSAVLLLSLPSSLFLFLPHPPFYENSPASFFLVLSCLLTILCVSWRREGVFWGSQACILSIIALFRPVIPDSDWSLWRLRPKNTSTCTGKPSLSYHWSVRQHSSAVWRGCSGCVRWSSGCDNYNDLSCVVLLSHAYKEENKMYKQKRALKLGLVIYFVRD